MHRDNYRPEYIFATRYTRTLAKKSEQFLVDFRRFPLAKYANDIILNYSKNA